MLRKIISYITSSLLIGIGGMFGTLSLGYMLYLLLSPAFDSKITHIIISALIMALGYIIYVVGEKMRLRRQNQHNSQ